MNSPLDSVIPVSTRNNALYVHLPWCAHKCPYCDFNSHTFRGPLPEAGYVAALERDLATEARRPRQGRIETVFIGGGTPSLFSASSIEQILTGADRHLGLASDAEITLEANPGSAERGRFEGYRSAGVTRLSLGIQSFHNHHLERLGRIHDARAARSAVQAARDAGFTRYNLDLMVGLPGQTVTEALSDVATALELGARHISQYQLTLEPGTAFAARPPRLPAESATATMQEQSAALLEAAGLAQYEISAWAAPQQACRHNLNYWRFGDYLAVGAGAHGKITDQRGSVWRYSKLASPRAYTRNAGTAEALAWQTPIAPDELPVEFMMNALRLLDGVPWGLLSERTGLPPAALQPALDEARAHGWLTWDDERLRCTAEGLATLNEVLLLFLPEAA